MQAMQTMRAILTRMRTIALVGASNKPERASYQVMQALLAQGYQVFPINPLLVGEEILGCPVLADLTEAPCPIDVVNVFRQSDQVPQIVQASIQVQAKSIWTQLGIEHPQATAQAQAAGLQVVTNACIAVELKKLT
ncbi:hypothetical protein SAMN05421831_1064 [Allopseudospirillum japonicum]|uniref:CoA-binding domain-containing protein n=1 Tax=Allopseudospirillum japonicum TaxID=64971 RepID=A0A1H6SEB8_9GAMM|nr:CoA-binding protein [Allopseudospirillum japonicum]SEI63127.1 hypothetical protein SAMN05421831_1064 [Allopseudospirillum japonicum]